MTEKPILFSGTMVRAILEGRKTMTRRVAMSSEEIVKGPFTGPARFNGELGIWQVKVQTFNSWSPLRVPYAVGDRLWVREAWRADPAHDRTKPSDLDANTVRINYEADGMRFESGKLRPSMFMPRWASRITLEVTAVKVERVRDITDDDALAEGVAMAIPPIAGIDIDIDGHYWPGGPKRMFKELWTSIHGKDAWERNEWVAAYTFKRVTT